MDFTYTSENGPGKSDIQESLNKRAFQNIICIGRQNTIFDQLQNSEQFKVKIFDSVEKFLEFNKVHKSSEISGFLLDYNVIGDPIFDWAFYLKSEISNNKMPIIIIGNLDNNQQVKAITYGADDVYTDTVLNPQDIIERFKFLVHFKNTSQNLKGKGFETSKREVNQSATFLQFFKRTLDITASSLILLMVSPLFVLIALAVKLDSKGPVFYVSKRAGYGYKIFNFFKFRTMKVDADKEMEKYINNNQYSANGHKSAFVKIANDPRITRVGHFLRNTSLDELPQLINVLKGDMSIVGNRPLPLYEAKALTKDGMAKRFAGQAGITGLWQVTKRGKSEMSEEERIALDIQYAEQASVWMDVNIMMKTFPALIQKEKV